MDVIVIGKKTFQRSDVPHVIYCGQSRDAALAAVAKTGGEFPFIYYVSPEPYMRINAPVAAAAAPEPAPAPEPKVSAKKAKVLT